MSIEAWVERAEHWLADNCARRAPAEDIRWGDGSDNVALFKNLSAADERAHISEVRHWQRRKGDAGYGSNANSTRRPATRPSESR